MRLGATVIYVISTFCEYALFRRVFIYSIHQSTSTITAQKLRQFIAVLIKLPTQGHAIYEWPLYAYV